MTMADHALNFPREFQAPPPQTIGRTLPQLSIGIEVLGKKTLNSIVNVEKRNKAKL